MRADTRGTSPGASLLSEARKARTLPRAATDMKYSVGISGPARAPRSPPRPHRRDRDRPALPAPAQPRPAALGGPALTCGRRRSRTPPPRAPPRVAAAAAPRPAAAAAQLPACSRRHAGPPRPAPAASGGGATARRALGCAERGQQRPRYFPLAPSLSPPRPSAPLRHSGGSVGGAAVGARPAAPPRAGGGPRLLSPRLRAGRRRPRSARPGGGRGRAAARHRARGGELMINLRAIEYLPKVAPRVGFNLVGGSVPPV